MLIPHVDFTMDFDMIETQLAHHGTAAAIFHSRETTFWSHLRGHSLLYGELMRCPLGTQIYAERDWRGWLEAARSNQAYYGRHGLRALLAGHHSNVRDSVKGAPFAARSWEPFNKAIDLMLEEGGGLKKAAALRV